REMGVGERIMLLKNDRGLGVKNGMLGEITELSSTHISLHLDTGREIAFDLKDYAHIDYGYAATIHKAQGVTVDCTHVLATPGLDRHSAYVALSRHRERLDLHYGQDDFESLDRLTTTLSRDRAKDMVSDYVREPREIQEISIRDPASSDQDLNTRRLAPQSEIKIPRTLLKDQAALFANRRGIGLEAERDIKIDAKFENKLEDKLNPEPQPSRYRGVFANFVPSVASSSRSKEFIDPVQTSAKEERRTRLYEAIQKHARSIEDIFELQSAKLPALPDQWAKLEETRKNLDALNPHYARDLEQAYPANRALVQETANGNPRRAIQILQAEAEIRANPELRADRFVQRWQSLTRQRDEQLTKRDFTTRQSLTNAMGDMARGLERDAQVESILRNRQRELGLSIGMEQSISRSLLIPLGLERQRSLGLSL
ncbi:MAG: Ti-type conjugative transfer relaxase TraA, partial [Methylocystis sp.]